MLITPGHLMQGARRIVAGPPIVSPTARAIWLDASDLATMKQDRTGASATIAAAVDAVVGSWFNKGTLGGWCTAAADNQRPILRSSGGLYWLEGDGIDDRFAMPAGWLALFQNVNKAMIAAAVRMGAGDPRSPIAWHNGSNANFARVMIYYSGGWTMSGRRLDGDAFGGTTGQGVDTADRVIRGHFDYANADAFLYRDGALLASNTSFQTAGSTSNTASLAGLVGAGASSSSFMNGRIYAIVADTLLPDHADIADTDAYLASKCGVTL